MRNSIRLICHFNWLLRTPTHTKKNYLSITFHSHKYFIDRCMSLIFASFHTKVIYGHTLWIIACEEGIFASAAHSVREKMANCNWMALMMCVLIFVGCFTFFQCFQLIYLSKAFPEIDFWPQDFFDFFQKLKLPQFFCVEMNKIKFGTLAFF